ncbi:hypothetical protein BT69DRAFT_1335733 [Atractiella rhizophila]|nr:hypothetical protein BT69DRAFT_1335733 [Atractiella rhizophila]
MQSLVHLSLVEAANDSFFGRNMDYEFSSQSLIERQALPNPFTALREELRLAVLLEPNTPTLRRLFLATLILIPLGIFIWMLGLVIRWWKDVDWYWKWEAGKFFRLNVYLFIPVGCSIFSAFFWVLVLGYYKIDGVSRADYFPYFDTFHGLVNFPILITGILAAHNALLSAPAAYYATQANAASTNVAQPKRAQSRFPYNINAQLFQWTLVTTVSIGLVPLFVISVFFGIWRERLLDTYVQLDDLLAIAESGGLFDLRDLAALETELKFQGNKTLRYGQAISIIHTVCFSIQTLFYTKKGTN